MNNLSLSKSDLNKALDQEHAQPTLKLGWQHMGTRTYQKSLKVGNHFLTMIVSKDICNSYIVFIEINGKKQALDIRASNLEIALNQTETMALEQLAKYNK